MGNEPSWPKMGHQAAQRLTTAGSHRLSGIKGGKSTELRAGSSEEFASRAESLSECWSCGQTWPLRNVPGHRESSHPGCRLASLSSVCTCSDLVGRSLGGAVLHEQKGVSGANKPVTSMATEVFPKTSPSPPSCSHVNFHIKNGISYRNHNYSKDASGYNPEL